MLICAQLCWRYAVQYNGALIEKSGAAGVQTHCFPAASFYVPIRALYDFRHLPEQERLSSRPLSFAQS